MYNQIGRSKVAYSKRFILAEIYCVKWSVRKYYVVSLVEQIMSADKIVQTRQSIRIKSA